MAAPIVLTEAQVERLGIYTSTLVIDLSAGPLNLDEAQAVEIKLRTMLGTVESAIKRVTEPQNDAPGMPNDTHGAASR